MFWDVHYTWALVTLLGLYHFSSRRPLPSFFLKGLTYVKPPTKEQVESLVPSPMTNFANKNKMNKALRGKKYTLELMQLKTDDLFFIGTSYYDYLDTLLFFTGLGLSSFFFGEFWCCLCSVPHSDFSFALVAMVPLIAFWFNLKILLVAGWWTENVRMAVGTGTFMGILAFALMRSAADYLDFDFSKWAEFLEELNLALTVLKIDKKVDLDLVWYLCCLALFCGMLSVLVLWPAYHHAKTYTFIKSSHYWAQVSPAECKTWSRPGVLRMMCHADHYYPLFVILLWVLPLTKGPAVHPDSQITNDVFDAIRSVAVLLGVGLRFAVFRTHAQAFLMPGLPSYNIDKDQALVMQQQLQTTLYCLPSFALQYLAHAISVFALLLLDKRQRKVCFGLCSCLLGGNTLVDLQGGFHLERARTLSENIATFLGRNLTVHSNIDSGDEKLQLVTLLNNRILGTSVSVLLCWIHLTYFVCSVFFHVYFDHKNSKKQR